VLEIHLLAQTLNIPHQNKRQILAFYYAMSVSLNTHLRTTLFWHAMTYNRVEAVFYNFVSMVDKQHGN